MNRLAGKIALVTGAAQGLGEAISKAFGKEGAHVILTDINEKHLEETTNEIKNEGCSASSLYLDVTNEEKWKEVTNSVLEQFGQLDILVNNAGIGVHGNIESTTFESWKNVLNINLDGTFLGTKYGAEAMIKAGNGGSIINMSSIAGLVGDPELLAYAASKGGVRLLTKAAALHLSKTKTNIRVNSIHPGYINTELIHLVPNVDEILSMVPMNKLGDPDVIGQAAVYLASDDSSFTTGSELVIDGGYTAQ
ncbi:glucose 1-dehydrogenase [Peribacillus glennii]|uniref:SDR family oxidoreductase n=1 Tax=Peribacillus glennii TaxID=2303991 RepID=A0A372LFL5_9BACI|nr:glucose 1-dehydrogenase [Peribacillus glennii]RFU65095.1 SDR family oxidoreductase [Peribacillus glennii]